MNSLISGRRKTSVARVKASNGKGNIIINGKNFEEYFPLEYLRLKILEPLKLTNKEGVYDFSVKVEGGGLTGQAEAIRHAISRTLVELDPNSKQILKSKNFLSFDSRIKERKKPGLHTARKRRQYRKR
ncbi:MAG TPA: 30S ribosomal protein S9 [Caldisericia bacterium]|nr:30S ribosomal protein S9 [Caldisericia bacterium]HRT37238.1 30S ribosomal protein S9 [Caldisericia bacterium]